MHERWKDIDMAVSLRFTGYPERAKRIDRELERVGLDTLPLWTFDTPADDLMLRQVRISKAGTPPTAMRKRYFSVSMGHYACWKVCRGLGAEHCLIVEDDVAFPKDLNRLTAALAAVPADYDVALLDKMKSHGTAVDYVRSQLRDRRVNDFWSRGWGEDGPRSTGAYLLSRRGLDLLINRWEDVLKLTPGRPFRVVDCLFGRNRLHAPFNLYVAHPNAAIQAPMEGGITVREFDEDNIFMQFYRDIGVDPEDYAI